MNKNRFLMIICLVVCVAISLSVVCASEDADNMTAGDGSEPDMLNDNENDVLKDTSESFTQLNSLINDPNVADGQTVNLTKDYVYCEGDDSFIAGIVCNKNIIIDGKGHTINGSDKARIFVIGSDSSHKVNSVILRNITFVNAYNDDSDKNTAFGAVSVKGNVSFEHCSFCNNNAHCAAAISVAYASNAHITDCEFINNTASGSGGGAIRLGEYVVDLTIKDSWFENNTASSDGGAVHVGDEEGIDGVTIDDCDFRGNVAGTYGGAVLSHAQKVIIKNSRFISNTAVNGSAIYLDNTANSAIDECYFEDNVARNNGGAIYCRGKFLQVTNSNFTRNGALNDGGSIFLDVGSYIYNCKFDHEHADHDGGAIYLYSKIKEMPQLPAGIELGVFSTEFINCSAGHDGGAGYVRGDFGVVKDTLLKDCTAGHDGGAGYIWGDYGRLIQSQLIFNTAYGNGGALYWAGNNGTITGTTYSFNRANSTDENSGKGASVYWKGDNGKIIDTDFDHYNATGDGGAIYVEGDNLNLTHITSKFGEARNGGAIYIWGNDTKIMDSDFTRNHARVDGGTLYIAGNNANISDSKLMLSYTYSGHGGCIYIDGNYTTIGHDTFINNTAQHFDEIYGQILGGCIYVRGTNTNIVYSSFQFGSATNGGSIYIEGSDTHVLYSNFTNIGTRIKMGEINYNSKGGSIYVAGNNTVISYDRFVQNNAGNGGAIYVAGDKTEISHDTFQQLLAGKGGAIFIEGDHTNITDSTFDRTNATYDGGAIYIAGEDTRISVPMFSLASANRGGALFIKGSGNVITSSFERCSAVTLNDSDAKGGAIYIEGDNNDIKNANFRQITAIGGQGGSIYIQGANTDILGSKFHMGFAVDGAGIYINGSNAHILHSNFTSLGAVLSSGNAQNLDHTTKGGAIFVEGDDAVISYDTFAQTNAGNGGGIYVAGERTEISHSTFTHHNAINGGAIYVAGNDTNITNSRFIEMYVVEDGGAVFLGGVNTHITSSNFIKANATRGGAIFINGSKSLIESSFQLCHATNEDGRVLTAGGAIYVEGDDNEIRNSKFNIVQALGGNGGAIYAGGSNTVIENIKTNITIAIKKVQGGNGGAIYIAGDSVKIRGSDFLVYNAADNGGAIYVAGNDANITTSSFAQGQANRGGVVFINGNDTYVDSVNMTRTTALRNGAMFYINGNGAEISNANLSYGLAIRSGGGVFINGSYNTIKESSFTYLNASQMYGGGIFINGEDNNITGSFFEFCSSTRGGAIYINGTDARVSYSNFTMVGVSPVSGITNHTDGGAIYISGERAIVEYGNFLKSNADHGGFIFIEGNDAKVSYSNFTNSSATDGGGAIYVSGEDAVIDHSSFRMHNSTQGGTIYVEGKGANITNSHFFRTLSQNGEGGAIYISGANANVVNSTFNQTRANNDDGGAIYIDGHHAKVSGSNFTMIIADNGGVIYIEGDDAVVEHSMFTLSNSINEGGSIYIEGADALIDWCDFEKHNATKGGTIYVSGDGASISNSNFTRSVARKSDGGSIYIKGDNVNVINSVFNQSESENGDGGAIYVAGNNANISGSDFIYVLSINGGVIYIEGDGAVVEHSNFSFSNSVKRGGSIYIEGKDALVDYCRFEKHNATEGGTIYVLGANANITNSNFTRSIARTGDGGSIYIKGDNVNVLNSLFNQTMSPSGDGGAIFIDGDSSVISQSDFIYSVADNRGGAIFIGGENNLITQSKFVFSNATKKSGGAIFIYGHNNNITHSSFENCSSYSGGAIFIEGANTQVTHSNFTRNGIRPDLLGNKDTNGGAIYIKGHNAYISESNFKLSVAYEGGFIYIGGDYATVEHSNFTQSTANKGGGAIDIHGSNGLIDDSSFKQHNATEKGGTINVEGHNVNITNSNFTLTSVSGSNAKGGAIHVGGDDVDVINCRFLMTRSYEGDGGAIYVKGDYANIDDSVFEMSSANNGGAVYIGGVNTTIDDSSFAMCSVKYNGGAIFISGRYAQIIDSNFSRNNATMNTTSKGGGIYVNGADATIRGSDFEKSNARSGAAVFIQGNDATIEKSKFNHSNVTDNGGAVYIGGNNALVNNSYFNSSSALGGSGGLIYISGNNANVSNSNFSRSVASGDGGAIYIGGKNTYIYNSRFSYHNATNGGAIIIKGRDTQIIDSYFEEGHTTSNGGAVFLGGNNTTIRNTKFFNNLARGDGGAIYNNGGTAVVLYSNFTNNTAKRTNGDARGGAIYWMGGASNDAVIGSYFENNRALNGQSLGGAIFWDNGKGTTFGASIINSTFYKNWVGRHGGAIDWFHADDSVIENCSFIENHANSDGGALYVGDDGSNGKNLTIRNCNFTNNYARVRGGALSLQFYDSHVINGLFINNSACEGGSVFMGNSKAKVSSYVNCTFINSSTHERIPGKDGSSNGGAVYINGPSDIGFIGCKFYNCTVYGAKDGGAIYLTDLTSNTLIDGCDFADNRNASNGGAIYSAAKNVKIVNSNFTSHNVSANGGAIYINASNAEISNSFIYGNVAVNGGAIYLDSSDVDISGTKITNNNATSGSGIYAKDSSYNLTNVRLLENQAHAKEFTNKSLGVDEKGCYVTAVFRGEDNLLNGIFHENSTAEFDNVTYWGVDGVRTTDTVPALSNAEVEINITVNKERVRSPGTVVVTDKDGAFKYYFENDGSKEIKFTFQHFEDNYYTGLYDEFNVTATLVTISIEDIYYGENATVNVTLTDIDGKNISGTVKVSINNTYNFIVKVINGTGSLNNVSGLPVGFYNATVTFEGDATHLGSENSTTFTVKPLSHIAIVKEVIISNVSMGDLVNFTIVVTNNGPSNATNVTVSDVLPAGLKYVKSGSNATSQGANSTANGRDVVKWDIGNMTIGQSISLWVQAKTTTNGTFGNVAVVRSSEGGENSSNVTNITVKPVVNLTVVKTPDRTNVSVGDLVNFTITVTNHGPSNATNVKIIDDLNAAFEFVNSTGNVEPVNGRLTWTIDEILNGTSKSVWVVVKVLSNGTYTNMALVNSSESNKTSTNETNITVSPKVNLTVIKTATVSDANVGDLVNFTIVVTNHGPSNATGVNVTDMLPAAMAFRNAGANVVGVTVTNSTLANGSTKVVWHIPKIINGTGVTLWILVNLTTNGTFTNVAFAASNENRTNSTNSTNITVKPVVDLVINKTVNKTVVLVNDLVEYTITVTNKGPSNATGVYVIDKLDKRLQLVNASKTSYDNVTGRWDIGNLAKGETAVLKLLVKVLTNGTIPNFANVTADQNDTNLTNNNDTSDNVTVNPKVNLTVVKTANVTGTVYVGGLVNFTITVTNHGPSNATDVEIIDKLNESFRFADAYGGVTPVNGVVKWVIPHIANGTSVSVWIQLEVLKAGNLTNVASVNSTENSTPSDGETNITVNPQVNFAVVKIVQNATANVGDVVKFTIVVTNTGRSNATGINVTDKLPAGMVYVDSGSSIGVRGQNTSGIVVWHIPDLANGTNVTVWVWVNLTTNGTFSNVALANSNENSTNSTNSTNITVKPVVDLIINKTVNKTVVLVNDLVEYTITVTNKGPSNATGVYVIDKLDERLQLVNASKTSYNDITGRWDIGNLAKGETAVLKLIVKVLTNGTIPNFANVTGDQNDTNLTNNNDTSDNVTVNPKVNLTVVKTANITGTVYVGDLVNFTITVTNHGPSNATNVEIVDKLNESFRFADAYGGVTPVNCVVKWVIPHIANGTSVTVWIQLQVLTNGTLTNVAVVNSTENKTTSENGTNITVNPQVNLTVVKIAQNATANVGDLVNFTIVVTNNGRSNATGVNVTDKLPAGMVYVDSGSSVGIKGVNKSNEVVWNIPHLANGTSVTVWVLVNLTTNGTFTNVAFAKSNENTTNSTNSTNITVNPVVDLIINKTVNKTAVLVNDLVEYTITVTNKGPSNATGVYVIDKLDKRLQLINASETSYNNVTGRWDIGNMAKGETAILKLIVKVLTNGTIPNFANVTADQNDTNETNNNVTSENVTVSPKVNLTVIKTADITGTIRVGDLVNFTITVTNNGPSNATDVEIIDRLNESFTWKAAYNNVQADNNNVVRWIIPHIANGTSATVWVQVQVMANGTFTNVAVVNSTENKTTSENGTNITVNPQVNLTLVKKANLTGNALVGDLVNFTITVYNNGLSNATGVRVSDELNAAFRFVDASGNYNKTGQLIQWTISNIENGTSASVWVVVKLLTNGTFTNIASVNSTEQNETFENGTTVTVDPQVNLTVVKIAKNATANVGDLVNFTIIVTNSGLSNATGVNVTDKLPAGMAYVDSGSSVGVKATANGNEVVWHIPLINNGTSIAVWVQVNLTANGTFTNVAFAKSNENTTDSTNSTNITVNPVVDLVISKTVNKTAVLVNDLVEYTITVTNKGPSNATGVYVTDKLDERLQLINVSETSYNNVTGRWDIGNLAKDETAILKLIVKVLTNGTIPNFANVTANQNDTNETNNNVTSENVTVSPKVNLTVIKTADVTGTVYVGDLVNFTITVTNHGPSNATNVEIVDKLNESFEWKASYGDIRPVNGIVKWIIPHIENGTSASVWVQVRVLANGTFTNVAVVNSTENRTTSENGTNITVKPQVSIAVIKTSNVTGNALVGDLVNFTITVTNNGLSEATDVQISDKLDAAFRYVDSNGRNDNGNVTWIIPKLANGTSASVWVTVKLLTNGTFTNVATASSSENSTVSQNETNVTVDPQVSLEVVKTAQISEAHVGDLVNFTIVVTNTGLSNATGVNVTDMLPAGMSLVNASGVYNRISVNGKDGVMWQIPKLANGTSANLWILVNLTTNGTFTNVAFATSNENATNSSNSTNITAKPAVSLIITKTVNKTEAYVGDIVEYTIEISNKGPSDATGVNVTDELDPMLQYVDSSATQGSYSPRTHVWTVNNITAGKSVTLTILAKILTNGTIANIAVVSCSENDTDKNASSQNVTARPQVNLTVVKKADIANVSVNDLVNFTIIITNNGLSNATGVTVTDDLIPEFRYVDSDGNNSGQRVTWNITKLANGTSASVWVQVRVLANGTFTNVAAASCAENTTVVTSNDTNVTVKPKVNLTIVKYVNVTADHNVSVGDTVKFTIVVTNHGPSNATDVRITDDLLPAFRFESANGTYTNSSQRVTWTIPQLAVGESYEVYVIVEAVDNGFYYNVAIVNSTESENKTSNKTDVTVLPAVNLTLVKKADIKNASVGDLVNFTIIVTNYGPSRATGVNITDVLPAGMVYVKSGGNVTGNNITSDKVVWNIQSLDKGEHVEVWVQVRLLTNGTMTNVAFANSNENTTGTSNSTDITVDPKVNLTVVKTSDVSGNVLVGDLVNFTITVTNHGPSNATNVEIVDKLDKAFGWIAAYDNIMADANNVVKWIIPHIENGTSASVWVQVRVLTNGTFTNVAVVNSTENKTTSQNSTNITSEPQVSLTVVKIAQNATANVDDLVNFTIIVTNNGLSNATGVNITDKLPAGMVYVDSGSDIGVRGTNNGNEVVWNIPVINNGANITVWVQVNLTSNGTFTNVAFAKSNENDTDSSNGTNITVNPVVDLAIKKTVNKTTVLVNDLVEYTIEITNNGPSNATGVYVIDKLDERLELVNASDDSYNNSTGRWDVGNLAKGETAVLKLLVKVLTNATIPNFANVTSNQKDTNETNNNVTSENVTVAPKVNLTVIKTADVTGDVLVGDLVNFTITVTNHGPSNATNVEIVDRLDKAFGWIAAYDNIRADSDNVVKWIIPHIENGTSMSVWVQVRVLTNGTFTNVAVVNSTENKTTSENGTNITVKPQVSLTVVKIAQNATADVGDLVNFTIIVTNNGLSNATGVNVTDKLPAGMVYVDSGSSVGIKGTNNGNEVVWNIPLIANGTSITVWVQVKLTSNGTFTNVAFAKSNENDTDSSNGTNITVNPVVDLAIKKTVNKTVVLVNDLVEYTIEITNNGPSNATDVYVIDKLDERLELVNASESSYNNSTGRWDVGNLAKGETATLTLIVRVLTNGTIPNAANVTANERDTNETNNNATCENVTAKPKVILTVIKTSDVSGNATAGDLVNFTITVTNNGPSNATNVEIVDRLDKSFEWKAAYDDVRPDSDNVVKWIIPRLENGTSASVWVQVRVMADGTFTNVATANSAENKTISQNETDITVNPQVNLTIVKKALNTTVRVGDLVVFTILVTNSGLSNATDVNVTDRLPAVMQYVDSGSDIGIKGNNTESGVVWIIPNIPGGTNVTVWVQVCVIAEGSFTNVAVVNSDENGTESTSGSNITVDPAVKLTVTKTVDLTNVTIGDIITYTIEVINEGPSDATGIEVHEDLRGTVDIIGIDPSKGDYSNGVWTIDELGFDEGASLTLTVMVKKAETVENTVTAWANENSTPVTASADNVTVNKMDTPINLTAVNITYGEDEKITVRLPVNVTGHVNITVAGITYDNRPISDGIVEITVSDLNAGDYNVTASYSGDGDYRPNSTNGTFNVAKVKPEIKIEVVDIWHGETEVLNVTVNAPGYVNITVNGRTITASLDHSVQTWDVLMAFNPLTYDGKATWNIKNLEVGQYPVSATYLGDENYESVSTDALFNVRALPSEVVVSADDIYVGEDASIQVSVTPGATGNVTIEVDGKNYTAKLTNGKAKIKVSGLKAGDYTVKVKYNGDDVYLPSENSTDFKVKKIKPPIDVDSHDIYVGDDERITVTLPEDATGTVTITVDGKKYTAPVRDGKAVFTVPGLKAGKYAVDASYSGDDKYLPTEGDDTFRVSKIRPDITVDSPDITIGEDGKITVTVPDDATGKVTIEIDGRRYTADVENGKAVFTVPGLKVGSYDIRVWYSGDDKYLPSETSGEMDVLPVEDDGVSHPAKGLEKHATGNPILILVVVLMAMAGLASRKFRK